MKHIKLFEDLPGMSDPIYGNDVFKIRYKSIGDLSNKKAPDSIDKPTNDVLDGIEPGDHVTGTGIHDEDKHTGIVVRVQKDENGENVLIEIEENGEVVEISAGSAEFAEAGDKGNRSGEKAEPANTGNIDYTMGGFDTFQPTTYENKNIKKFKDYNGK